MQLKEIIDYVQSKFDSLITKKKLSSDEEILVHVFKTVLSLLDGSRHGMYLNKIAEAIRYLQRLPISRLFGSAPLSEILRREGVKILPDENTNYAISTPLSNAKIFGLIQFNLMSYYQKFQHRSWHYAYEKLNQPVKLKHNKIIRDWQTIQTTITTYNKQAYQDYMRNLKILNKSGGNEEEITSRLNELVTNSSYPVRHHALLLYWLEENGGQSNLGFVLDSILEHHFTDDEVGELPRGTFIQQMSGNWFVDKNGKITLHYAFTISAIHYNHALLLTNRGGKVEKIYDQPTMQAELERYSILQKQGKKLPPLLNFEIMIRLEIESLLAQPDRVIPEVVLYHVSSFTDQLKSPARLVAHNKTLTDTTLGNENNSKYCP